MRRTAVPLIAAIALLIGASSAAAATFNVTGTTDGAGSCTGASCTTIRAALAAAAANGISSLDTINVPAGTYTLTQAAGGELNVNSNVLMAGVNAATTIIQGDGKNFRIVDIGAEHTDLLSHMTIKSGAATTTTDPSGGGVSVGAGANAFFDHVRITGNQALRGGGLAILGGHATMAYSLIDNNTAVSGSGTSGDGGGINILATAGGLTSNLALTDSTVAHNAALWGAGIIAQGNSANTTSLERVTVAYNANSTRRGGGLYFADTENFTIKSSLISNNTGNINTDGTTIGPTNCNATVFSDLGGNVDSGTDCGMKLSSDRQGVDPQVSTLLTTINTGGETPVLPIARTSNAVDLYSCTGSLFDQRDLARPQGTLCDAGAYEFDKTPPDTAISSGPSGPINSTSASFAFTSTESGSTFECRLDGPGSTVGSYTSCTTPKSYTSLANGAYTFMVHAIDSSQNTDATAAVSSFTVDTVPPDTTITGGPTGATNGTGTVVHVHLQRGRPELRVPARHAFGHRHVQLLRVPEGLHDDRQRRLHVQRPRDRRRRQHRRLARHTRVHGRHRRAGHDDQLRSDGHDQLDGAVVHVHVERGRPELRVPPRHAFGHRHVRLLRVPEGLHDDRQRRLHVQRPRDRRRRQHRLDAGHAQLHRRHHRARHDDHGRAVGPDERHSAVVHLHVHRGQLVVPMQARHAVGQRHVRGLHVADSSDTATQGDYTFSVRATDSVSNQDATPATRAFTIDTSHPTRRSPQAPCGIIGSGATVDPASPSPRRTRRSSASSTRRARPPATTRAARRRRSTLNLADGTYTFSSAPRDSSRQSRTRSPATRAFTVDTTPPPAPRRSPCPPPTRC